MLADQVCSSQILIARALSVPVLGNYAAQTPSMRELGMVLFESNY